MKTPEQKLKHAALMKEWRAKNRERAREISRTGSKRHKEANPEKVAESKRVSAKKRYKERNAEDPNRLARLLAAKRAYNLKHRHDPVFMAKKAAAGRKWREANPEKAREIARKGSAKWRLLNPEKAKETDERRAKRYAKARETQRRQREAVLTFLGGCCNKCKEPDRLLLQVDHIHGGGRKSETATPHRQFKMMQKDPEKMLRDHQLLCANCHFKKTLASGAYQANRRVFS